MNQVLRVYLLLSLCLLVGCNERKRRGATGLGENPPIVLIGQSVARCEECLGAPMRIHNSSPEARSYVHSGLHIQISFERGVSSAVVFRKAVKSGSAPRNLSDSDRSLVYQFCGAREEDLQMILNNASGKWETFSNHSTGEKYLIATDNGRSHSMTIVPDSEETLKAMRQYMKSKLPR